MMMISRLCARLAARASFAKPFEGYFFDYGINVMPVSTVLGPEVTLVCDLVKFVPAVAYHFCLNLPATFSQPCTKKYSQLCTLTKKIRRIC